MQNKKYRRGATEPALSEVEGWESNNPGPQKLVILPRNKVRGKNLNDVCSTASLGFFPRV